MQYERSGASAHLIAFLRTVDDFIARGIFDCRRTRIPKYLRYRKRGAVQFFTRICLGPRLLFKA